MKQSHKCRYRQGCLYILIFMENVDTTKRCDAHGKGHINREIFKKHLHFLSFSVIITKLEIELVFFKEVQTHGKM